MTEQPMTWEAIGAIGEVLGAVAVLATLIYLARQIKQNSNMMKANIKEQRAAATQVQIQRRIDMADVMTKGASNKELSPSEAFQVQTYFRGAMRNYETYFGQYSSGLFDEEEWAGIAKGLEKLLENPVLEAEWNSTQGDYSENFQKYIASLRE